MTATVDELEGSINFCPAPWPRQHKGRQERDGEGNGKEKEQGVLSGEKTFSVFLVDFTAPASKGCLMKKQATSSAAAPNLIIAKARAVCPCCPPNVVPQCANGARS